MSMCRTSLCFSSSSVKELSVSRKVDTGSTEASEGEVTMSRISDPSSPELNWRYKEASMISWNTIDRVKASPPRWAASAASMTACRASLFHLATRWDVRYSLLAGTSRVGAAGRETNSFGGARVETAAGVGLGGGGGGGGGGALATGDRIGGGACAMLGLCGTLEAPRPPPPIGPPPLLCRLSPPPRPPRGLF